MAEEIKEVVKKHKECNIPLDAVYMDIDYMERYKDFTINEDVFPEFEDGDFVFMAWGYEANHDREMLYNLFKYSDYELYFKRFKHLWHY